MISAGSGCSWTAPAAIGWISSDLLSYSPVPASFYVSLSTVYLRNCADYNCTPLQLLRRGDRVDKLDQDSRGWWRVRSFSSGATGWIPAAALSIRPGPPYYYVNVSSLALRSGPSTSNRMLTSLGLNQRVEVLGSGPAVGCKCGIPGPISSAGSYGRYLESFPVSAPRSVPKRRSPAHRRRPRPGSPKAM